MSHITLYSNCLRQESLNFGHQIFQLTAKTMEVSGKRKEKNHSKFSLNGSEDDIQLHCQPCERDGLRIPAYGYCQDCTEHLCKTCFKTHRKPAPLRNHVLLDKSKMPRAQDLTEHCQQHHGETIRYFCCNHNILGCSPCVTLNHRTCKVDYIPDALKNYKTSEEYRNLLQTLHSLQEDCKKITLTTELSTKKILQNHNSIKTEIKKLRQEINQTLDKWEAEIDQQASLLLKEEITKTEYTKQECDKVATEIRQLQDDLKTLESSNQNNQMFLKVKKSERNLMDYQKDISKLQETECIQKVQFQPNIAIQDMFKTEICLGQLVSHQDRDTKHTQKEPPTSKQGPPNSSQQEMPAKLLKEQLKSLERGVYDSLTPAMSKSIDVKIPGDKECNIRALLVIAVDQLAIADYGNKSIKVVDTKQQKVVSNVTLSSGPYDMTLLPGKQMAVTLPVEKKILVLSMHVRLSLVRQMKLKSICYGLASNDGNLIVTFSGKVQIITLEGEVIRTSTIQYDQCGDKIFCQTWYTAVDKTNKIFYVSDASQSNITCVNLKGEVISGYKDSKMSYSYGLAVLQDGCILVCGAGLHLISHDLSNSRILLQTDEIPGLMCLAVDSEQNKLYLGCLKSSIVQVYDLKWN